MQVLWHITPGEQRTRVHAGLLGATRVVVGAARAVRRCGASCDCWDFNMSEETHVQKAVIQRCGPEEVVAGGSFSPTFLNRPFPALFPLQTQNLLHASGPTTKPRGRHDRGRWNDRRRLARKKTCRDGTLRRSVLSLSARSTASFLTSVSISQYLPICTHALLATHPAPLSSAQPEVHHAHQPLWRQPCPLVLPDSRLVPPADSCARSGHKDGLNLIRHCRPQLASTGLCPRLLHLVHWWSACDGELALCPCRVSRWLRPPLSASPLRPGCLRPNDRRVHQQCGHDVSAMRAKTAFIRSRAESAPPASSTVTLATETPRHSV